MSSNNTVIDTHRDGTGVAKHFGLSPIVAGTMIALDYMLFTGLESWSMEMLAVVSAFVGFLAVLPCALIQKYSYGDSWPLAWAKSMLVGLLTAIPTPLPSFLTCGWGVMGFIGGMEERARLRKAAPAGEPSHYDAGEN